MIRDSTDPTKGQPDSLHEYHGVITEIIDPASSSSSSSSSDPLPTTYKVAIEIPTSTGTRTSTTRIIHGVRKWPSDDVLPAVGDSVWIHYYIGYWFLRYPGKDGSSGGSSGTGCLPCCDTMDCAPQSMATVVLCAAAVNGALEQYKYNVGSFPEFPTLGGNRTFVYDSDCLWLDDPVTVSGTTSSSSSGSGTYQWQMAVSLDTDGILQADITLELLSGDDVVGVT